MFTIKYLKFYPNCGYLKNLKTGVEYSLEHKLSPNFFGENICVTAIVGKNGSGKSSLIDMIFRIMNNLSYCLYHNIPRDKADNMGYIKGLKADLCYKTSDGEGLIQVRGGKLFLRFENHKYMFISYADDPHENNDLINIDPREYFQPPISNIEDQFKIELAKKLFYTVATNYSLQAFVAQDCEEKLAHNPDDDIDNININSYWLNTLFHKNDGYIVPIVLNPYRDNGMIDMHKEEQLTETRLAAILVEEKSDNPYIDDYHFKELKIKWNHEIFHNKLFAFTNNIVNSYHQTPYLHAAYPSSFRNYDFATEINDFREILSIPNSVPSLILNKLGCDYNQRMDNLQVDIRMYAAYKVLSIANNYPQYIDFKSKLGHINYKFSTFQTIDDSISYENIKALNDLIDKELVDTSHIALKLHQALNFIKNSENVPESEFYEEITYDKYEELLGIQNEAMNIPERMSWLPPGIFNTEIFMSKDGDNEGIPLNQMSSGERQFMYLTSTIAYHALNLSSVPDNEERIKYRNLNLILDEVEICFHPDYQRLFLNRLIKLLGYLHLNKFFDINIILTTHSPFLLSDIPQTNILYLKDGKIYGKDNIRVNPFAANVIEILSQSFFLDNGFIGDFAKSKISEAIDEIGNNHDIDNKRKKEIKEIISLIGEPLLRHSLQEFYLSKFQDDKQDLIEYHRKRIEELENS